MSYSIDANLLRYASNSGCREHAAARAFVMERAADPDLFCLTWPTIFAYLRYRDPSLHLRTSAFLRDGLVESAPTHEPAARLSHGEQEDFLSHYEMATKGVVVRGNLVPTRTSRRFSTNTG